MVKDHKELVRVCGELNLNTLKDKIEVEYQKYLSGLQKIKNVRNDIKTKHNILTGNRRMLFNGQRKSESNMKK
jgi:hypothetical protein